MKKILVTALALYSITLAYAGDGDKFVNVQAGLMYRNTANVLVAMEFEKKHHTSWEIYLDMTTSWYKCEIDNTIFCKESFWDYKTIGLGVAYKPAFYRWKNANLRARFGGDIGIDEGYSFYASIDIGIEASYSFKNRLQVFLTQKNDFAFGTRDNVKNGLLFGIKIPIN